MNRDLGWPSCFNARDLGGYETVDGRRTRWRAIVRSDNLCLRDGAAVLVDWNWAVVGNPTVDLAGWASSLTSEGGPPPESVAPDAPELASLLAGYFAAQAGLPAPAFAPRVRQVQLSQARVALPWAARALGIEEPGGA